MGKKSKDNLIYICLRSSVEGVDRSTCEPEIKTAWQNAVKKQTPFISAKTYEKMTYSGKVKDFPKISWGRRWGLGIYVAVFKNASEAKSFYDILKNTKAVKKYGLLPRTYR